MPLAYEFDLDHHALLAKGWDHVTLGDALEYFEEVAAMPTDLTGSVEYMDLSEVTLFKVSETGALQLAAAYEEVLSRGIVGIVIHVTSERIQQIAEMVAFTLSEVCGGFRDGYRIARHPVPPEDVHRFLKNEDAKGASIPLVA